MKKTLIVIPARAGSKRLPRKNTLTLIDKPLIQWTIDAALDANLDATVLVSSDDEAVINIAKEYDHFGLIAHRRPPELATDSAATVSVLIDAIESVSNDDYKPETVILLQPTSPLRSAKDIEKSFLMYDAVKCKDTVVSVCEIDHPIEWSGVVSDNGYLFGLDLQKTRSQDIAKRFRLNGAIYIADSALVLKNKNIFTDRLKAFVMPRERSVDIDEELDFYLCECILRN